MSIFLSLDSSSLDQNNHRPDDFTVSFDRAINVSDGQYELALIRCNAWYSWSNISAEKSNNLLAYYSTYGIPGWRQVLFPDGQYTITDINNFLQSQMIANNDFITSPSGIREFPITIAPNYSTLRTDITLLPGFRLDFTQSQLCLLLGWTQQIVLVSGAGANLANINDSINSIVVRCSLITSSYKNGISSDYLWQFVPTSPPGSNINVEVSNLIYLPVLEPSQISRIRMYITDQLGRRIDFRGEPVTYLVHMRRINASDKTHNDPYGK